MPSSSRERPTILVADDEEALRSVIVDILDEEGYSAQGFPGGQALLQALVNGPLPNLILLDVVMPDLGGYAVLGCLQEREDWRDLPVVLMTAALHPRLPAQVCSLLPKPFAMNELLAVVAEHYARARVGLRYSP
jgi:CheY-like chemotaxis protein